MGKLKLHPSCTDPGAAIKLARFLFEGVSEGTYPFDITEPGLALARNIGKLGNDLDLLDEELRARIVFYYSLVDIGMDSMHLAVQLAKSFGEYFDLYDPKTVYMEEQRYQETRNMSHAGNGNNSASPRDRTEELLRNNIGHRLWRCLHSWWVENAIGLTTDFGGKVLTLLRDSPSASEIHRLLTSNEQGGLIPDYKCKRFPGFGPKTSRVFVARASSSGLMKNNGLCKIGPPIDIHAMMLSVGCCLLDYEKVQEAYPDRDVESRGVPASTLISALHALWAETCEKYDLDVTKLYQGLWLWGRRMCRQVRCTDCPLWERSHIKKSKKRPRCLGRVSTASYYGSDEGGGGRVIFPSNMIDPRSFQLELDIGESPELPGDITIFYNNSDNLLAEARLLSLPVGQMVLPGMI